MKKTLVIGSTVADIVLKIPALPTAGEDININSQQLQIGGCAFNVAHILNLTETPNILCSPVGSGIYGDFVAAELEKQGIKPFIRMPEPNGCCYCIVDNSGERSFLSYHGAEYLFSKDWMKNIDMSTVDSIYVCGLEIEDTCGKEIVSFLEENKNLNIFFAPGPRIKNIPKTLIRRVLKLSPILHLNQKEAFEFTGLKTLESCAKKLHKMTNNKVIITLGNNGTFYIDNGKSFHVPGVPSKIKDTIGAGDAHLGYIIYTIKSGVPFNIAVRRANIISAAVVSISGGKLSEEQFKKACSSFH